MFAQPHLNTRGLGEFSKVMQTLDYVSGLNNCLEFSLVFSWGYVNTEKVFYCLVSVQWLEVVCKIYKVTQEYLVETNGSVKFLRRL